MNRIQEEGAVNFAACVEDAPSIFQRAKLVTDYVEEEAAEVIDQARCLWAKRYGARATCESATTRRRRDFATVTKVQDSKGSLRDRASVVERPSGRNEGHLCHLQRVQSTT